MKFEHIAIIGAGTMGHGIAHVSAAAGYKVTLYDVDEARVSAGVAKVKAALDKGVEKGKVTVEAREQTLSLLGATTELAQLAGAKAADLGAKAAEQLKPLLDQVAAKIKPLMEQVMPAAKQHVAKAE